MSAASLYLNWVFKMSTSCSNTWSKSLSEWRDCLINELLWQILPYRQRGSLQFGNVGRWLFVFSNVIFMSEWQFNDLFTV